MGIFGTSRMKRSPFGLNGYMPKRDIDDDGIPDAQQMGQTDITPSAQPQGRSPSFWQGGDKIRGRDALAAVLATIGDTFDPRGGAVDNLIDRRNGALELVKKAREQAAQVAAARQRAVAAGMNGPQADIIANGDAKFSDLYSKPTTEQQNFQFYQGLDPTGRQQYGQYRDAFDPTITNGYGSQFVPRSAMTGQPNSSSSPVPGSIEDGHQFMGGDPADPRNWKPVGGGVGNGVGGFLGR